MLSIIIPSHKDPLLTKTVESLLENSELEAHELEIICVMDGWWTEPIDDPRVKVLHHGKAKGMREAINQGVRMSQGEFIMRTDEHCMFGPGYDRILTERFKDDWIVYPKRFFLDTEKWEIMDLPPNIYNKLIIDNSRHKFAGIDWPQRELDRPTKLIDESMAMQGSCWIMKKSWWNKIGELDSVNYGTHYGDSHEMVFKTWKLGGRLMVNKNTWHAHKHRSFNRTHNYGEREARPGWDYSIERWGEYFKEIKAKWKI